MELTETEPTPRPCSHAGCFTPAVAALAFDYKTRKVWLHDLPNPPDPASYDLCAEHTARFRPPRGWEVQDLRAETTAALQDEMFRADAI